MNNNPFATGTPFQNSYRVESDGLVQGDAQDDPNIRMSLAAGVVASPILWPGMGVAEMIQPPAGNKAGPRVAEASATELTAFTVINQAHHGVIQSGDDVPQYAQGSGIHFYRIGSGARIPLPVSAAVAALADGTTVNNATSFVWDATNKCIDVATTGGVQLRLLLISPAGNMVAQRDATTGKMTWTDSPVGLFLI